MAGYTIRDAEFIVSNTSVAKCPAADRPEFAFIGRSNVGKSSLINMLTVRKGLAKTSATPGKTQLINHFLVNNAWYLVDLPGYGYARTSQSTKAGWDKMIRDYLLKRENLMTVFVLVDVRHEPQKIDVEFINWLGEQGVP
nr:YihA family ribosome biogenesis GTP-binding protein [Bacteroidia bacterium]